MKINHITTAHPRNDTRVFHKIFKDIKTNFEPVFLYVADGLGDDDMHGVIDVCRGKPTNARITKIFFMTKHLLGKRGQIMHFHDPELVPLMLLLSMKNKIVFDIHEDFLASIPQKFRYGPLRFFIKIVLLMLLYFASSRFYFVLAEADYKRKYRSKLITSVVKNYPDLDKLAVSRVSSRKIAGTVNLLYIGSMTVERGFSVMCDIVLKLNRRSTQMRYELHLIGDGPALSSLAPSPFVTAHGRLDIESAYTFSQSCHFGLCLLWPTENYINSIPTKILEYNAVNLPFFVSDFTFYKSICANFRGAISVRHDDVDTVVEHIEKCVNDKALYRDLVENDNYASDYSWSEQKERLLGLYNSILGS